MLSVPVELFKDELEKTDRNIERGFNQHRFFVDNSVTNYSKEELISLVLESEPIDIEEGKNDFKQGNRVILAFIRLMDILIENKIVIIHRSEMIDFLDSLVPNLSSFYFPELFKRLLDYIDLLGEVQEDHNSMDWVDGILEFLAMEESFQSACEINHIASSICYTVYEIVDAYMKKKDYHQIKYDIESFGRVPKRITSYRYKGKDFKESAMEINSLDNGICILSNLDEVLFFEFENGETLYVNSYGYGTITPFMEELFIEDEEYEVIDILNEIPQIKDQVFVQMWVSMDVCISGIMRKKSNRVFFEFGNGFTIQKGNLEMRDQIKNLVEVNPY